MVGRIIRQIWVIIESVHHLLSSAYMSTQMGSPTRIPRPPTQTGSPTWTLRPPTQMGLPTRTPRPPTQTSRSPTEAGSPTRTSRPPTQTGSATRTPRPPTTRIFMETSSCSHGQSLTRFQPLSPLWRSKEKVAETSTLPVMVWPFW